ncbi:hypothetical protein [Parafrankia sp. EUN1f]|uniref:hypothetical protein n=1 Tax=Parafrankia sp. EUN1f TaxID=102897 RepID=UPI00030A91DC|nr:hypothetical protein [Parafrankia sp. EUN1f]
MRVQETTVLADYHQFIVFSRNGAGDEGHVPEGCGDGLVVVNKAILKVLTGTSYGEVGVRLELHNGEPELPAPGWTEVSDTSFHLRKGPLEIGTLMGGPEPDSLDLAFAGPGWYRIRVAASGRDDGPRGGPVPPGGPHERFVIAVWAGPRAPAVTHRGSDRTGRAFRGEPLAPKLDEAVEGPARVAFRDLLHLLRTGAGAASAATGRIDRTTAVAVPPERMSEWLANPDFWAGWLGGGGGSTDLRGGWSSHLDTTDSLKIVGEMMRGPAAVHTSWNYERLTTPSAADPFPRREPLLPSASQVDIDWAPGGTGTLVSVRHRDVPQVLTACLEDLWHYYLARLAGLGEAGAFSQLPW